MVLPVSQFFGIDNNKSSRRIPRHTSFSRTSRDNFSYGRFNNLYTKFFALFRRSPELMAVIDVVATDIIGDRPRFVGLDGRPLSSDKMVDARKFWIANRMKETIKAIVIDMAVTGDGYGWKGRLDDGEKARLVKEISKRYSKHIADYQVKTMMLKALQDEDLKSVKKFDYIPSSTVTINADETDVLGYTQYVNANPITFTPQEILHFRWLTADGKLEGISPVQPLVRDVVLLHYVKHNMEAYLRNGGNPDIVYNLKTMKPGSPSYESALDNIRSYNDVNNRHGSLTLTGDVDLLDPNFGTKKDLEYEKLALLSISTIAFAFHMPVNRLPFLIGKSATNGDSGGLGDQGYWNMISEKQDLIEDIVNYQLTSELGFHIELPRKYKQDEVREAQTFSMNADTVQKLQSIYKLHGKKISINKINELLDIEPDEVEDLEPMERLSDVEKTGLMNQNLLDNMSVMKEPDNRKRAGTKRNVANQRDAEDVNV